MANKNRTIFQRLTDVVINTGNTPPSTRRDIQYNLSPSSDEVLYRFGSKEERDTKLKQLKQQKLLAHQWARIGYDTTMEQLAGVTQVRLMYRDADLMDATFPEISAALDIYAEEATCIGSKSADGGTGVINVYSKSERVKSVLEDLFVNRLDCHIMLEMIARSVCKYGNEYMFLNIDGKNGVLGWRELPVHEMRRVENGMMNAYGGIYSAPAAELKPDEVKFVWEGHNESAPYRNWQVAHFRLIKDNLFLPYGVSILNKARRAWRMLSMMEDGMLLYRLERSVERRVFKVNVGLIDDADVPAFLQEFMNNVKRAPIIDPQTGQLDLRKNFLDVSADYVIPVRNGQDPTSIDNLQPAQNPTSMDDIEYMQNKILSALRLPKTFLNFDEAQGKGQNLAIMDIRFARSVNSVQRALLMELTKIAIIHLYILGFTDDLTNFSLTMNNPSSQLESLELENQQKRINNATAALSEMGGGIPLMSWHRVQKDIMGLTDSEISDMLNEIRLESAISMELQLTSQIIKKTGVFKRADNLYGEPGAEYDYSQMQGDQGGLGGGMGGGGGMMGGFGDELGDLGEPGASDEGVLGGTEESVPLEGADAGQLMEGGSKLGRYITEYRRLIGRDADRGNDDVGIPLVDKAFVINESIDAAIKDIEDNRLETII